MVDLTRTVRIGLRPAWSIAETLARPRRNTFAGWPSLDGVGISCEIDVTCRGQPNPATGYLVNITEIDDAVRKTAVEWLHTTSARNGDLMAALGPLKRAIEGRLSHAVHEVRLHVTRHTSFSVQGDLMTTVLIAQSFEFSAAHRLHAPALSDEENRRVFGKCNNPNGHGHNYRLEVSVAVDAERSGFRLDDLEGLVASLVVARFDHKHLNLDTEEFRALNPSVENIAKVCHDILVSPIRQAGGELRRIRLWETEKTSASYPAT